MQSVVSALTSAETGLTAAKIFGAVADLVPYLVMIIPVSIGIYFLRRLVKGTGKAKVKF